VSLVQSVDYLEHLCGVSSCSALYVGSSHCQLFLYEFHRRIHIVDNDTSRQLGSNVVVPIDNRFMRGQLELGQHYMTGGACEGLSSTRGKLEAGGRRDPECTLCLGAPTDWVIQTYA
jgi:hypothetical protein